ncbi:hypothetical protein EVAR_42737_1 [Eumeta japonica]|uniref:Uncharacterized protein n=1 Tax=Eumeta variegata TaxID=151549 RepID=A0A4C1XIV7_EUMVA|nr:hypothetical protein EVAR_42737_1 [Eumeta japonica]
METPHTFDSDHGPVLDSALHPAFNSDFATNHDSDLNEVGETELKAESGLELEAETRSGSWLTALNIRYGHKSLRDMSLHPPQRTVLGYL